MGLLANNDPAARQYAEWTGKSCRADGLRYELRTLDDPIDVERALIDANEDPRVHGIIVYYPIFGQEESFSGASQDDYLRDTVSHKCDVEGLCHLYRTNLYRNVRYLDYPTNDQKCLLPCTALSVVKILEACPGCYQYDKPTGRKLEGRTVTVINRSEIVGRPLAAMLANDGADVYSIDINSIYVFRGGRLHPCDETPESCVRKVRMYFDLFCGSSQFTTMRWKNSGKPLVCFKVQLCSRNLYFLFLLCFQSDCAFFGSCQLPPRPPVVCSRPLSSRGSPPRTTSSPPNGSSPTRPSSTWRPSRTSTRRASSRCPESFTFPWWGRSRWRCWSGT